MNGEELARHNTEGSGQVPWDADDIPEPSKARARAAIACIVVCVAIVGISAALEVWS